MNRKQAFYNRYGVEEYYVYDPEDRDLSGWQRVEGSLEVIAPIAGWVSPRLGIRLKLGEEGLEIYRPDGGRFLSYLELDERRELAERRAEQERERAERLAAKLRELNIDPDSL